MPGGRPPLPTSDLDHVLEHAAGAWDDLRGGRLFITGGTGFFGAWMLESFLRANDELRLGATAVVLTRDPARFAELAPRVAGHPTIATHNGDVRSFDAPAGPFTHVLHMATETALAGSATASFNTAVDGTTRVLDLAVASGTKKLLLTSSGAVYGVQPPDLPRITEGFLGAPRSEDSTAGYGHGKRAAEFLCCAAAADTGLAVKIARCFAFVGPGLPLDGTFAVGNLIRDALRGDAIEVTGDGTARRSYLYAADLAAWLWTILVRGASGRPYNVGSGADVSIAELAATVARVVRPGIPVRIGGTPSFGQLASRYVPDVARAETELGLRPLVALDDAIARTAAWHQGRSSDGPLGR
ncbi:MAG: NAD(P)-dependent oxidoreductase [Isosphaeraceae bacterium]|nr:NAD(P)-dependent oxidoreductase [Isosphaeraceae bacterium]